MTGSCLTNKEIGLKGYFISDLFLVILEGLFINMQINDRLKDLCREELAEKERKQQEDLKRQTERENFLPRRKTKFSAMITKVFFVFLLLHLSSMSSKDVT